MAWKETLLFYKESPYQRIAFFTEKDGTLSLTLNDFWQFNSGCEHIYHECLFTAPGLFPDNLEHALVLGGGDGLGARELLKYKSIKSIDLIDLDPEMIKFAKDNVFMQNLNKNSFKNSKVDITVTDAKKWLAQPVTKKYDLIIVDFPDPTTDELWDLYTVKLYKQIAKRLTPRGVVAVQSSTYNTRTFELIYDRLDKVFPFLLGYHTGASRVFCGFFLCSFTPIKMQRPLPKSCKWINPKMLNQIFALPLMEAESIRSRIRKPSAKANLKQFVGSAVKNKTLGEEKSEFFERETVSTLPPSKSIIKNPIVVGSLAVLLAAPLVLRYV